MKTTDFDTTKPHSARMYDHYLGGKDHYQVDEEAAAQVMAVFPGIRTCARENRSFMHRVTRWLTSEVGIRQFLDIGTGIPTEPNLHQVAQSVAPDARVVYTDNDPIVLAYAQALLTGAPEGRTAYIQADVRDPERIMGAPELHETLDLSKPVALSLNALFHFIPDEDKPYELVRQLVDPLPSGSYLIMTHCTPDFAPEIWEKIIEIYHQGGIPAKVRTRSQVEAFFEGLELIEPGVQEPHLWRPEGEPTALDSADGSFWVGVARKP
ncbi:SAM-dependent methyltransferase [Streptomyces sp. NPDC000941]